MSKTLLRSALPHRFVAALVAVFVGLLMAVVPLSASTASASGVSASRGLQARAIAARQIGIPYVWGGTTRSGFDCSGLTQYSWRLAGRHIPRTAQQQYGASIKLRPHMQRAGDLVFFHSGSSIYHEGMYAGNGYMIVARHTGTRVQRQRIWSTTVLYGRVR